MIIPLSSVPPHLPSPSAALHHPPPLPPSPSPFLLLLSSPSPHPSSSPPYFPISFSLHSFPRLVLPSSLSLMSRRLSNSPSQRYGFPYTLRDSARRSCCLVDYVAMGDCIRTVTKRKAFCVCLGQIDKCTDGCRNIDRERDTKTDRHIETERY